MLILDLCGGTGAWSEPYRAAGYAVIVVDPLANGQRVEDYQPPSGVHGILAAPPCTEFAGSGARWWPNKPPHLLDDAVRTVRHCLRIIEAAKPAWWALENPVGRIARCVPELGKFRATFDPCDYGDPYTKRTCLWGDFTMPPKAPVPITHPKGSSPIHRATPGPDRWRFRSATPPGFARAFCEANP